MKLRWTKATALLAGVACALALAPLSVQWQTNGPVEIIADTEARGASGGGGPAERGTRLGGQGGPAAEGASGASRRYQEQHRSAEQQGPGAKARSQRREERRDGQGSGLEPYLERHREQRAFDGSLDEALRSQDQRMETRRGR